MILLLSFLGLSRRKPIAGLCRPNERKGVSKEGFLVACGEYP